MKHSKQFISALLLSYLTLFITLADASAQQRRAADQPLDIRSQSPLHGLRYTPTPRSGFTRAAGSKTISASLDVSSIWANSEVFVMDFNMMDLEITYEQGLGNGWSTYFSVTERRVVNAHLDQATISFHKLFGLGQDGRTEIPKHRTLIEIPEYDIYFDDFQNSVFSRPFIAGISKQVIQTPNSGMSVSLFAQTELHSSSWKDSGDLDLSLQGDYQKSLNKLTLFASLALSHLDQTEVFGLPLRQELFMAAGGAGWQWSERGAFILQYLVNKGASKDLGELTKRNHELSLGYRWQFEKWEAEGAVTENLFHFYNSPDIAFHGSVKIYI